jgi:transketolase
MKEIENFRQWGSLTPGHPEVHHTPGVETTTGPLGQGLATAVGMAMAEAHLAARFGKDVVDHRTWVIAGDGCLMEGVSHEAISIAGRLKLSKLTVLFDDNNTTIDGEATIAETGDQLARFKAAGWAVKAVDGHDHGKIAAALRWATKQDRPTLIACKTLISKGAGPQGRRPPQPRLHPVRRPDPRRAPGHGLGRPAVHRAGRHRQGLEERRPPRRPRPQGLGSDRRRPRRWPTTSPAP